MDPLNSSPSSTFCALLKTPPTQIAIPSTIEEDSEDVYPLALDSLCLSSLTLFSQAPRSKHPPRSCLPTSHVTCLSDTQSMDRSYIWIRARAQIPRQERVRSHQEPHAFSNPLAKRSKSSRPTSKCLPSGVPPCSPLCLPFAQLHTAAGSLTTRKRMAPTSSNSPLC